MKTSLRTAVLACVLLPGAAAAQEQSDEVRFLTNRQSEVELELTDEKPMFQFAVFGDRTGGPADGVKVLADAVRDVNLIRPDMVMTVGDLVQGYNQTPQWMRQMIEFKAIMDGLEMPWYPVAGNHDVYWRGPERPPLEHEGNYETHFGPLWYAFEHKDCWFIALFSDETNPDTGAKNFGVPDNHRMSPEQFQWLDSVLERTEGAKHVFVFLHHPRWFGGRYGDHWQTVHERLVKAGNVRAVFAGHVHHMRYDAADGIEYFTLATVGGAQSGTVPRAGWLHHYNLVTVRDDSIAVGAYPVGEVIDHRMLTQDVLDQAIVVKDRMTPEYTGRIRVGEGYAADSFVTLQVTNPTQHPVDLTLVPTSTDRRWHFVPDHTHTILEPNTQFGLRLRAMRDAAELDGAFDLPSVEIQADLLIGAQRVQIPAVSHALPLDVELAAPPQPEVEHALRLNGRSDWAIIASRDLKIPDGPLTVEGWCKAESFGDRVGLIAKTEGSEFGIFVSGGRPEFSVHLDGTYRNAGRNIERQIPTDEWVHLAGVYDGEEVRLYMNGTLLDKQPAGGHRKTNALPLVVGADVDRAGNGTSPFHGWIDEVRISTITRYRGESFEPQRRLESDVDTALLLHMDANLGPWLYDSSPDRVTVTRRGNARVVAD